MSVHVQVICDDVVLLEGGVEIVRILFAGYDVAKGEPVPDPQEDVRMKLAERVADKVDRIADKQAKMGATLETVSKLVAEDHDVLNRMDEVQRELVEASKQTATASIKVADIAEARAIRDAEQARQDREDAQNRWKFLSDNKLLIAVIFAGIFAPQLVPQLSSMLGVPQVHQSPIVVSPSLPPSSDLESIP